MRWKKYSEEKPEKGKQALLLWEKYGEFLVSDSAFSYNTPPDYWLYISAPGEIEKIPTPSDIYDELFDEYLSPDWEHNKELGLTVATEQVGRIIEFLEKHLERWEMPKGVKSESIS